MDQGGRDVGSSRRPRGGDQRETLIEAHLPLVRAVARRYAGHGVELDDLVQAGSLGLVKASDRFDPERGVAFAAFAAPVIEGEIRHHLRDRATTVRLPRRLQQLAAQARRRGDELAVSLGRRPTTSELAVALDADASEVQLALDAQSAATPLPLSDEDNSVAASIEPAAAAHDRLLVESRLRELAPRERQIVYLRFHADLTERQIAAELGISQAHVSRLLTAALNQLRATDLPTDARPGQGTGPSIAAPEEPGQGAEDQPDAEPVPGAEPSPRHSGRFLVRMPSELHGALADAAERRHVSLNRFVTDTLADAVGQTPTPPDQRSPGAPPAPQEPTGEVSKATDRPRVRAFRLVLAANVIVIAVAAALAVALIVLAIERGL